MTPYAHDDDRTRLILPALGGFYAALRDVAELVLRVAAGGLLAVHGYGKILDPFANAGMVESLGFFPGAFWSPALAATEFFGGILLALGLLTRPAALGAAIVLVVTIYFHWVVKAEGLAGAEKSILWSAIAFYFFAAGGGRFSLDRALGREV
jgi:putative oxidoreductase